MTTYYVDANAGSDLNNGLTPATAYASIDKPTYSPNTVLMVARGGSYLVTTLYKSLNTGMQMLAYGVGGNNASILNCTVVGNNTGPFGITNVGDIDFTSLCDNGIVRNCAIVGSTNYGVANESFVSSRTSMTVDHNYISGYKTSRLQGGIAAETNPVTGNLNMASDYRPMIGSCLLPPSGYDSGYIRDKDMKQSRKHVGAFGSGRIRNVFLPVKGALT